MSGPEDEDDKPTVVLDLNALKNQRLKEEEELANLATELEFTVHQDKAKESPRVVRKPPIQKISKGSGEEFAEKFLIERKASEAKGFTVIFFDYQSDFFKNAAKNFPTGHDYKFTQNLNDLNTHLRSKNFQIVVFNYDSNPKVVNQLSAQIKSKFPSTKVLIIAKNISPEKAKIHQATASGASGYYQLPLDPEKIDKEFRKIHSQIKKVG